METPTVSQAEISNQPFHSSPQLEKLFAAISKCQAQMEGAKKDSENPFFKSNYADLEACWAACRKPMTDNGLAIIQLTMPGVQTVKVQNVLCHVSGQWISSITEVTPVKRDPQATGSAITYARRYGLMAILGIAPEDDDGNASSHAGQSKVDSRPATVNQPIKGRDLPAAQGELSGKQLTRLYAIRGKAIKENRWTQEQIKEFMELAFNMQSSKELKTKTQYDEICGALEGTYIDAMANHHGGAPVPSFEDQPSGLYPQ